MINSLVFGGAEGYEALKTKVEALEIGLEETCSGGCEDWWRSEAGVERYASLKKMNDDRKAQGLSHI